jgi:hypothetical protein
MGKRDPLHLPGDVKGQLVPYYSTKQLPLLPFEKQLIETLGCTEDEYRKFALEAIFRGRVRPAEYELIPDIQNGPALVPALISLAIGLATTAVGYLLAPKPNAAATEQVRQRQLGSRQQGNRFAATFGFDSQAELADYNDPIPVVFGRYTGTSGGILVAPSLVWSRMFSYGNQQAVKLLFVVGEQGRDGGQVPQGIAPPNLSGIFLGNGALNSVFAANYAIYWKRNTTSSGYSRVLASNLIYGTRGTAASGDPETFDDIFTCPTAYSDNDYGFSSSHSLTNNAEFGCYSAIPNGTAYRVNWRVITIPELDGQEDDPGNNLIFERIKIAGNGGRADETSKTGVRELGQGGEGRNYSRRMGVISLNNVPVSGNGTEERNVSVGDTIEFMISNEKIPNTFYSEGKVKVDDINSEIKEQCIAADDAMQVGELFMIGRSVWQVTARKLPMWRRKSDEQQIITLKCLEIPEVNSRIGLVSRTILTSHVLGDVISDNKHVGIAFYPLMRFATAVVSNTRACEVTEIGLRSNVFQRLNGLCNFQSLPTPTELIAAEKNKVNITSGTQNIYITRASVFTVQLRPAGLDANGQPFKWAPLGMRFAVINSRPVDIYSFLRFKHPQKGRYEFRLVPKNGADLRLTPDSAVIWQLSTKGSGNELLATNVPTDYGLFEVRSTGEVVTKFDITSNNELAARPRFQNAAKTEPLPSQVGIYSYLPDVNNDDGRATAIEYLNVYSDPTGFTEGRSHAFAFELFGGAGASTVPLGGSIEQVFTESLPGGRWARIRYRALKATLPAGHYSGRNYTWQFQNYWIEDSSRNFTIGTEFIAQRTLSSGNPFRVNPNQGTMVSAGLVFKVTSVTGFNPNQGRAQGLYEELFGPARNYSVGRTTSLQLDLTSTGGKKIRMVLDSVVERADDHWSGQTKLWSHPVISVVRDSLHTSTTWNAYETFNIERVVSYTNPFQSYGAGATYVGAVFQILSITEREVTPATFDAERIFEYQSQYADISYYGDLIEKSNNSSPEHAVTYVNEMVSNQTIPTYENMTICGLALKAGRNFSSLDQLRVWLPEGLHVRRFHPDDNGSTGPSNLFCDLIYYFLTNQVGGLGPFLGMSGLNAPLINTDDLVKTARFLKANSLFYDGVIGTSRNFRQFVSDTAPFFLCNFVISDGRFSLVPALPTTSGGQISTGAVPIKQLFTAGNILEDSFELEYLDAEDRKDFQAIMRYREQSRDQLPQERNLVIRWNDSSDFAPVESFDLTEYCTSEAHAKLVGKFFLSIRRRITHTISFATSPYGLNLAPGDYIKVVTQSSPYNPAKNGTVAGDGAITSAQSLENGQYRILYYKSDFGDVTTTTMTVTSGKVAEQALWNSVFTVLDETISQNIYTVEQLTFNEDGTVQISASEFPCNTAGASLIAQDVVQDANFVFER